MLGLPDFQHNIKGGWELTVIQVTSDSIFDWTFTTGIQEEVD